MGAWITTGFRRGSMADHIEAAHIVDLPIRYIRNPVSGKWAYVIELSSILGGPFRSREEAEENAVEALAAVLRRPHGVSVRNEEIGHLQVEIPSTRHGRGAVRPAAGVRLFDGPLVKPTRQRLGAA
jgi:hypothetical protein